MCQAHFTKAETSKKVLKKVSNDFCFVEICSRAIFLMKRYVMPLGLNRQIDPEIEFVVLSMEWLFKDVSSYF